MLNKIMLIGNVGADPEQAPSYSKLVTFNLATSEYIKDKESGEFKELTTWHKIKCFGYVAEKALKLGKGSKVYIEGKFRSDSYENKEGKKVTTYYVMCDKITHLNKLTTAKERWASNLEKKPELDLDTNDGGFIPWDQ
jgi:single-strand DNA-binding protein